MYPYVFVADDDFSLKTYMIKPYPGQATKMTCQDTSATIGYPEQDELWKTHLESWQQDSEYTEDLRIANVETV